MICMSLGVLPMCSVAFRIAYKLYGAEHVVLHLHVYYLCVLYAHFSIPCNLNHIQSPP